MKKKIISIGEAVPGMIVAEDILGLQDYLIIPAHSELTNHSITRLKFYAISKIAIEILDDGEVAQQGFTDMISDTYSEYVKKTPEFKKFKGSYEVILQDFKHKMEVINDSLKEPLDSEELLNDIETVLSQSRNGTHVMHMLHCMRDNDDVTYAHSISTALFCNVVGRWLNYSEADVNVLTLAGLLHDIGKICIPSAILHKPERLTQMEFDIVKHHPLDGYKLLKNQKLDPRILKVAFMHHERLDGSGYPNGLKGDQIDTFAQVVGLADIYIAMISPRTYRRACCPFDAISVFEKEGFMKFSPEILLPFLKNMANTYINCTVQLNDDSIGQIIMINPDNITKPVVKIGNAFVDLAKHKTLLIQELL